MTIPIDATHLDRDWQIRLAAFDALRRISEASGGVVTRQQLTDGFTFEEVKIPFANRQKGIFRPRQLARPLGIALSITTIAPKPGVEPRYDDDIGADGWFEYRYQGTDPGDWDNVALRAAFEHNRPLIYFYGLAPGIFEPLFPVYVLGDDPGRLTFSVAADTPTLGSPSLLTTGSTVLMKEYATQVVKARLHQKRFRELVVRAYQEKCAVCSLGTNDRLLRLLDAAHILPDHDRRGLPEIPNGLALCKIHHSAYDLNIVGISPDYLVHVNTDILAERDGPMLQFGIQRMEGRQLHVPRMAVQQPNREYLAERFEAFKAA